MLRQISNSMFKIWFDFFRIKLLIFFKSLTWRDQSNYYYCLYQCNRCFSWFVMQIKFLWFFYSILQVGSEVFLKKTLSKTLRVRVRSDKIAEFEANTNLTTTLFSKFQNYCDNESIFVIFATLKRAHFALQFWLNKWKL